MAFAAWGLVAVVDFDFLAMARIGTNVRRFAAMLLYSGAGSYPFLVLHVGLFSLCLRQLNLDFQTPRLDLEDGGR